MRRSTTGAVVGAVVDFATTAASAGAVAGSAARCAGASVGATSITDGGGVGVAVARAGVLGSIAHLQTGVTRPSAATGA